jgi:hypothetical protein
VCVCIGGVKGKGEGSSSTPVRAPPWVSVGWAWRCLTRCRCTSDEKVSTVRQGGFSSISPADPAPLLSPLAKPKTKSPKRKCRPPAPHRHFCVCTRSWFTLTPSMPSLFSPIRHSHAPQALPYGRTTTQPTFCLHTSTSPPCTNHPAGYLPLALSCCFPISAHAFFDALVSPS